MHSTIKKWGNSAAIRIPAAIMAAANLSQDMEVEIQAEDGYITITRFDATNSRLKTYWLRLHRKTSIP